MSSNENPGTGDLPFLSIQHAINKIGKSDTIIVHAGFYPERIQFKHWMDISDSSKTVIIAKPRRSVSMLGFNTAFCNNLLIQGFKIVDTPSLKGWTTKDGIFLNSKRIEINDCEFNGIGSWAINFTGFQGRIPDSCKIVNNYVYKCGGGFSLVGSGHLVENNEIERLINYGEIGDADYTRFNCQNTVFRNNYFHGTIAEEVKPAHVDGFQCFTLDGKSNIVENITIENNIVINMSQGVIIHGERANNINIYNNVFARGLMGNAHGAWGVLVKGGADSIRVYNNTIYEFLYGIGIGDKSTAYSVNNIVLAKLPYNTNSLSSNFLVSQNNVLYDTDGTKLKSNDFPFEIINFYPRFVDEENNCFQLDNWSLAIDCGSNLSQFINSDNLGIPRPQGIGWDIGAYEYVPLNTDTTNSIKKLKTTPK